MSERVAAPSLEMGPSEAILDGPIFLSKGLDVIGLAYHAEILKNSTQAKALLLEELHAAVVAGNA